MGRSTKTAGAIMFLAFFAANALADGKFFWRDPIPPEIPNQRALIVFDEGDQALILQSRYRSETNEAIPNIGWVVPLPSIPELASMTPVKADSMFHALGRVSRPTVFRLFNIPIYLFFFVVGTSLVVWIICVFRENTPSIAKIRLACVKILAICLLILVLFGLLLPALSRTGGISRVEIIHAERVGVYDARVVRADDSAALIEWLNENDFAFNETDRNAFDDYISRGWIFVVATVAPDADRGEVVSGGGHRGYIDGMTAPLIMRFQHPQPVYPLALTGTGGYDTQVLLFILARNRMESGGRIELRYAGKADDYIREDLLGFIEPKGFLDGMDIENLGYLTKFRETLTPERMSEDIVFDRAPDDKPYRERVVVW